MFSFKILHEIHAVVIPHRVPLQEPPDLRVVLPRAKIIDPALGVQSSPCEKERIAGDERYL